MCQAVIQCATYDLLYCLVDSVCFVFVVVCNGADTNLRVEMHERVHYIIVATRSYCFNMNLFDFVVEIEYGPNY